MPVKREPLDFDPLLNAERLIRNWTKKWGTPQLAEELTCEWSPRLTRSLGRAYPKRKLVRLSRVILQPEHRQFFEEVLCHEIAHVAVFLIHGPEAVIHGDEWKQLVTKAGYTARRGIAIPGIPRNRPSLRYEHRCPVCHSKRYAKRPQLKWRCVGCKGNGLTGELEVRSIPKAELNS